MKFDQVIELLDRVEISTDPRILDNLIDINKPIFLDTETTELYRGIRLVQLYQPHWDIPLVFDIRDCSLSAIYERLEGLKVVCHNISFDAACFENDLNIINGAFKNFDDTLLLAKLSLYRELDEFSLDKCFEYLCNYDVYGSVLMHFNTEGKKLTKSILQKSFVSTITRDGTTIDVTKVQLVYSALDVLLLPTLYERCLDKLEEDAKWSYELDKGFILNARKWERYGMPIIPSKLKEFKNETYKDIKHHELRIEELAPGLNVNSPLQVTKVLKTSSSDALTLKNLMLQGNELAGCIYHLRRLKKQMNFLERYSSQDHRIRGFFSPLNASGRVRCSGSDRVGYDNLMQIPKSLKHLFGFEAKDPRCLVYADFAQLELRTACVEHGDEVLYELFTRGKDLHTYVASQIYNIPEGEVTPDQRQMGKFCNFGLLYLGSPTMFRNLLIKMGDREPPSIEECDRIVKTWRSIYPGVHKWHQALFNKNRRGDMLNKTLMGRPFKAKLYTDLAGIQNQGLGSEVAKLTLHYLFKVHPNLKLLNFIHDSFILEAGDIDEGKALAQLLANTMVKAWGEIIKYTKLPNLPMPTTAHIFKEWEGESLWEYTTEGFVNDEI